MWAILWLKETEYSSFYEVIAIYVFYMLVESLTISIIVSNSISVCRKLNFKSCEHGDTARSKTKKKGVSDTSQTQIKCRKVSFLLLFMNQLPTNANESTFSTSTKRGRTDEHR